MPTKPQPWDQDDDLVVTLGVTDKDDVVTDADALTVEITRPRSGTVDSFSLIDDDLLRVATGAYKFTYRVPDEWGIYHGTAASDIPGGRVTQQFDFSVQKPRQGP
jgi:hypothetical protein